MHRISPLRNASSAKFGFYLANFALIFVFYSKIDDPLAFLLIASGFLLFGFFIKRGLGRLLGE